MITLAAALKMYPDFRRPAYLQMLKDTLPSSDHVIDGTRAPAEIAPEIAKIARQGG